ncbi:hypothetical protein HYE67_001591 [Fusarium culmorum]|uniref:Uncharacterized protein n=1 Tax=Fusarium culmorum TaxID=5516 RepID=A0A7S8CZZ4_FUSCU|nr:hypothetical protein HYE67_001591 [Fusarium culmorum]
MSVDRRRVGGRDAARLYETTVVRTRVEEDRAVEAQRMPRRLQCKAECNSSSRPRQVDRPYCCLPARLYLSLSSQVRYRRQRNNEGMRSYRCRRSIRILLVQTQVGLFRLSGYVSWASQRLFLLLNWLPEDYSLNRSRSVDLRGGWLISADSELKSGRRSRGWRICRSCRVGWWSGSRLSFAKVPGARL